MVEVHIEGYALFCFIYLLNNQINILTINPKCDILVLIKGLLLNLFIHK